MVYPSLTAGLMVSHQIFATTANIENFREKATNKIQLYQNQMGGCTELCNSTVTELEGTQQVQITT